MIVSIDFITNVQYLNLLGLSLAVKNHKRQKKNF